MTEQITMKDVREKTESREADSCLHCIEILRYRFRGRGVMTTMHRDSGAQMREAMRARAIAPTAYANYAKQERISDRYRSGEEDGVKYMTAADFVRYYQAHRRQARPDADLRFMAVVRDNGVLVPTRGKQKKPFFEPAGEADRIAARKLVSHLPSAIRDKHPDLEERTAEVRKWLRADTIQCAPKSQKRRFPTSVASAILVMTISLSLVVSGAAMHSDANADYRGAVDELNALKSEEMALERELEVKNDLLEIEDYAKNTLGMIDREYVAGSYLDETAEERVEVYEKETPRFGLATLLSAFGIGD